MAKKRPHIPAFGTHYIPPRSPDNKISLHFGKEEIEIVSCITCGLRFGYLQTPAPFDYTAYCEGHFLSECVNTKREHSYNEIRCSHCGETMGFANRSSKELNQYPWELFICWDCAPEITYHNIHWKLREKVMNFYRDVREYNELNFVEEETED